MDNVNALAFYLVLLVPIGVAVAALLALAVDALRPPERRVPPSTPWTQSLPGAVPDRTTVAG